MVTKWQDKHSLRLVCTQFFISNMHSTHLLVSVKILSAKLVQASLEVPAKKNHEKLRTFTAFFLGWLSRLWICVTWLRIYRPSTLECEKFKYKPVYTDVQAIMMTHFSVDFRRLRYYKPTLTTISWNTCTNAGCTNLNTAVSRVLRSTYLCKWRCRWNIISFTTLFTTLTTAIIHSLLLIRLLTLRMSDKGVWWDGGAKRRRGCQREEIVKLLWSHLFGFSWNTEGWLCVI